MPRPRSILIAFVAAALVGSAAGWAASYRQSAPLTLSTRPAAVVTVSGPQLLGAVRWQVLPAARFQTWDQSIAILDPGTFTVVAVPPGDVGPILVTTVTVPPSEPAPVPGPSPAPGPAPVTPVVVAPAGQLYVMTVFDTSKQIALPAGQLAIWQSQTIVPALKAMGVIYRHYALTDTDPAAIAAVKAVTDAKITLPAIVFWRNKAAVQSPLNLPATEGDILTLTKGVQP